MLVVRDVSSNCLCSEGPWPRKRANPFPIAVVVDEHSRTDAYVALAYEMASCQSVQIPIGKSKELIGGSFVAMFQAHEGSDCYVGRLHDCPTRRTASRIS
jgi:hypothetical protein